jgi:hypothetical protein
LPPLCELSDFTLQIEMAILRRQFRFAAVQFCSCLPSSMRDLHESYLAAASHGNIQSNHERHHDPSGNGEHSRADAFGGGDS